MTKEEVSKLLKHLEMTQEQWQSAMNSAERIEQIGSSKDIYWLKKAAPPRGVFRYHALNFFSWLLRIPLLKAVPQPGGNQAINNEINRINQLAEAGISVPQIMARDKDWLLIKDVGQSIIKTLKQKDTSQSVRQHLFQSCLGALKHLHLKQQYLSQAFIRNMLIDSETQTITFIDFEDDPIEVMSLAEAQARDVLLLVNSTARFFVQDQMFFNQAIQHFLTDHQPAVIDALKTTTSRMQWITKIPFQGLFGHDYQKLKVGILALKDI